MMNKLIVVFSILFIVSNLNAQKSEFGLGIGVSTYYGDLSSPGLLNNLKQSHPAFDVFYNYYFNKNINTRLSLAYGKISGNDSYSSQSWQVERNLSFESSIYEFSGLIEYNILGTHHLINPYLFGGINTFHFNPKTLYKGDWVYLQPLGTEGQGSDLHPDRPKYNLVDMSIVFGLGTKVKVNKSLYIAFEIGWRRSNSDYLDDVSKDYVGYSELKRINGELAAELSDMTGEYFGNADYAGRIPEKKEEAK